ncbi:MAG: HD domain-containing protein [Opitutaceae bacterium]|nr:HD domain-containing protein [Opitutaceae bacterium]
MSEVPTPTVQQLKSAEGPLGRPFTAILLLRKVTTRTASNGSPFLSVELADRTGAFTANVWSDHPDFETVRGATEGAGAKVEGRTDFYQQRFSPKLTRIHLLAEEDLHAAGVMDQLVEVAPEPAAAMWAEFSQMVDAIRHDEVRMTVRGVFEEIGEAFQTAPAAIAMHHAYRHGLLEHSLRMARAARALLPLYPEVDADLAMAGILVHDTGKVIEYEGALATRRSRRGILQGHVVLGYQLVRKHGLRARLDADRLERLEHIVLSHQGEPEWGAAVYAATPEAVFVSMVDNLDAKMGMVQRILRQASQGDEFSERHPGLNSSVLVKKLPPS